MPHLTDLAGNPMTWEELLRRNAEWYATHDRHGGVVVIVPVRRKAGRVVNVRTCVTCGNVITSGGYRYCSDACRPSYYVPHPRVPREPRPCARCGEPIRTGRLYCSLSCAQTACQSGKTNPIREALVDRYGRDTTVPYGTLTAISHEFGVTRERVRQIALSVGITTAFAPTAHCETCGVEVSPKARWCRAHDADGRRKYVDEVRVCPECGTQFVWTPTRQIEATHNVKIGRSSPEALTSPVCSVACGARRGVRSREQRKHALKGEA